MVLNKGHLILHMIDGFDLELKLVELMNYGDCNERCERAPKCAGLADTTSSPTALSISSHTFGSNPSKTFLTFNASSPISI